MNPPLASQCKPLFSLLSFLLLICYAQLGFAEAQATSSQPINLLEEKERFEALRSTADKQGFQSIGEGLEPDDESIFDYRVELLVFAYQNTGDENAEFWRELERPTFENLHPSYRPQTSEQVNIEADENQINTENDETSLLPLTFLDPSDPEVSLMHDILKKMKINGRYRTLQHLIWEQRVNEEAEETLFYLDGGEQYLLEGPLHQWQEDRLHLSSDAKLDEQTLSKISQYELEGTLRIYRSRFLHIHSDLWLSEYVTNDAGLCLVNEQKKLEDSDKRQEEEVKLSAAEDFSQGAHPTSANHPATFSPITNFKLQQHRRIRSGELHYLDHPRFGFLIHFTRLNPPGSSDETSQEEQNEQTQP